MLKKVKNWLGIEGVKLSISSIEVDQENRSVLGQIILTSGSEQEIEAIKVIIQEKYTRGRRKSKLSDIYTLASTIIEVDKSINPNESIPLDFSIGYDLKESSIDRFGNKNIFNKGLSGIAKLVKGVKSEYSCTVEAYVSGNRLKPFDKVLVEL